jgi:hypothetical protein
MSRQESSMDYGVYTDTGIYFLWHASPTYFGLSSRRYRVCKSSWFTLGMLSTSLGYICSVAPQFQYGEDMSLRETQPAISTHCHACSMTLNLKRLGSSLLVRRETSLGGRVKRLVTRPQISPHYLPLVRRNAIRRDLWGLQDWYIRQLDRLERTPFCCSLERLLLVLRLSIG